ncbi:MAG: hypothetical protein ACLQUW_10170 [Desulfobaccales bacterium]
MSNDAYLRSLLAQQNLTQDQLNSLRSLREQIEGQLSVLQGSPRFYYAGSFSKKTMIQESFDLDIVVYWPHNCGYSLKGIFNAVGEILKKHWNYPTPKTVSWELRFQGGFHIDVVPGRAIDGTFKYANLYRRDNDSSLQTSIKVHIDTIRNSGRGDTIRLMKLWRAKRGVPFQKSLALELITIEGCKGVRTDDLEGQLLSALKYVRDNIITVRIVDPANTNNIISDEISAPARLQIRTAASSALKAQSWSQVLT